LRTLGSRRRRANAGAHPGFVSADAEETIAGLLDDDDLGVPLIDPELVKGALKGGGDTLTGCLDPLHGQRGLRARFP
jgi:hypothetical protein